MVVLSHAQNMAAVENGWEIDHVHPVALGGSDKLKNYSRYTGKITRSKRMSTLTTGNSVLGLGKET